MKSKCCHCGISWLDNTQFSLVISARTSWANTYHSNYSTSLIHQTHTRLTALCPGLPRWAGTRKVKPIWILLKQETVSGSGISWDICKSAHRSRQITMPAPPFSFLQAGCPSWCPTNSVKALKGISVIHQLCLNSTISSSEHSSYGGCLSLFSLLVYFFYQTSVNFFSKINPSLQFWGANNLSNVKKLIWCVKLTTVKSSRNSASVHSSFTV